MQEHDYPDEFVKRLRQRVDSDPKLTMTSLSVQAGLSKTAIRDFFNGRAKSPTLTTMTKILAVLGETLEEFMGQPQTASERDILRLVGQLHERERMQLLGFAKALAAERDSAPPEDPTEN